ncbi:MAG: hypothetical protein GY943_20525 [Chloroflexi bacterium]|nr:hypothetical protein [Chloroflexota bacterium]
MKNEKIVKYVARQLGLFQRHDKIAQTLSTSYGLDYNQARQFVRFVEIKHARRVAAARLPLVLLLGIPTLLGGALLLFRLVGFLYYGMISVRAIYMGVIGLGMVTGSLWGILKVVLKLFGD